MRFRAFDFLTTPIYALDLSDQSYKFLRLTRSGKQLTVADFGEGAIPKGIIEHGVIRNHSGLVVLLRAFFSKHHIEFVAFSLPEELGFLRTIRLVDIKKDEIESAIEFQLEEHIPVPVKDVFFEYNIILEKQDHFDVAVHAFPKAVVESYADAIFRAGATPALAEPELEAIFRAVIPESVTKSGLIIDWGKTRTSFSVFENGALQFSSTAFIKGVPYDWGASKGLAIPEEFGEIKEKVTHIIEYWQTHSVQKTEIKNIFLTGGGANVEGLIDYLSRELHLSVSLTQPWGNVSFPQHYLPPIVFSDAIRFTVAIGLALEAQKYEFL